MDTFNRTNRTDRHPEEFERQLPRLPDRKIRGRHEGGPIMQFDRRDWEVAFEEGESELFVDTREDTPVAEGAPQAKDRLPDRLETRTGSAPIDDDKPCSRCGGRLTRSIEWETTTPDVAHLCTALARAYRDLEDLHTKMFAAWSACEWPNPKGWRTTTKREGRHGRFTTATVSATAAYNRFCALYDDFLKARDAIQSLEDRRTPLWSRRDLTPGEPLPFFMEWAAIEKPETYAVEVLTCVNGHRTYPSLTALSTPTAENR